MEADLSDEWFQRLKTPTRKETAEESDLPYYFLHEIIDERLFKCY